MRVGRLLRTADGSLPDDQVLPDRGAVADVDAPDLIGRIPGRIFQDKVPWSWVVALAAMLCVYFFTCGAPRLFDQIDGQYAGAAREMMERGNWLIPTQDGVPRLQKPPFVYWCETLSMSLFGINEFGARFPVALATAGFLIATGLLARRVVGTWSAGVAGALILATFMGTFFFTHLVMPEPFLSCFLVLSFWAVLKAIEADEMPDKGSEVDLWLMIAWTFVALGALSKGIHGLLIPAAAVFCSAGLRPTLRGISRKFLLRPQGWILFLTILAPWYLVTEFRYPGFLKDHFFNEQIGSALNRRWPPDSDRVPLWIFWIEHLALLFPISLLFPASIRAALQKRKDRRPWFSDNGLILLAWFVIVALGITFSNIQDYYLMIAWTPVAIWIAWAVTRNTISFHWPAIIVGILGVSGIGIASFLAISHGSYSGDSSGSNSLIADTILNVFQVLPPPVWREVVPLLYAASASALVVGILVYLFDRKGKSELCLAGFALLMGAVFVIGTRAMQLLEDEFSSSKVAEFIDSRNSPGSVVIAQGDPNEKTTLFFYVHQPIFWVDGHPNLEFATRSLGIGLNHYLTREQVGEAWEGTKRVFLVIEGTALAEWETYLGLNRDGPKPIGTSGSRVILVNR
ncbi:MAG: glycosyltransferase family 39 protein [Verrucomicrobia bacterium]|nr:glycosyltransferase family 39 protein [Verrucomicrobiota bacterium]